MVVLEVRGVDCYYGSVKVLENIHFSVKEGDFVGILGPNGSGKTTLLRSISRTLEPKTGTILLNDENIYAMKSVEVARNLAVVPQETAIAFDFTALDIVFMGRNPHISRFKMESTKDLAIAKKAMERTNTWYLAERPINELSGGEKQRVIIARALTQEPKVLLLDEPTTHLDINNQLEIMDLLEKLCKDEGLTLIAVIHDFNLATRYCDSAILLNNGSIFSIGSVDNVLTCDNIRKVFDVDMIVKRHPITDLLYVIPLYVSKSKALQSKNMVVHVISGHGTGTTLMKLLLEQGYSVTSGVLSILDTDYDAACAFGIPVASEAPFSPITEENHKANLSMIEEAKAVIVTDVPFGQGNLKNLEAVKAALEKKKTTIIFEKIPIQQRDFTKGKAQNYFEDLKDKGAIVVKNYEEAFSILEASKTRE